MNPKIISTGETPLTAYEKMSKSKYNGVDPTVCTSILTVSLTLPAIALQIISFIDGSKSPWRGPN